MEEDHWVRPSDWKPTGLHVTGKLTPEQRDIIRRNAVMPKWARRLTYAAIILIVWGLFSALVYGLVQIASRVTATH